MWDAVRYVARRVFGHEVAASHSRLEKRELALSAAGIIVVGLMGAAASASPNYFRPNPPSPSEIELRHR